MTTLVGTGPFKMDSYQNGVGVTLSRFDDYHGGAVKLDGVSYKFIEDVNTQVLEYQKGNVDYVDVDPSIYSGILSNPELKDHMHGFPADWKLQPAYELQDLSGRKGKRSNCSFR